MNLEIGDYIWFLLAVTLVAGVSFDSTTLEDSLVRKKHPGNPEVLS